MRRTWGVSCLVVLLLATGCTSERSSRGIPRPDPQFTKVATYVGIGLAVGMAAYVAYDTYRRGCWWDSDDDPCDWP